MHEPQATSEPAKGDRECERHEEKRRGEERRGEKRREAENTSGAFASNITQTAATRTPLIVA